MIQDLNQEGKITLLCLITKAEPARTAKNAPYLSLTLEDSSGILDAKFWNLTEEQTKFWKAGMVVEATGDLMRYRNAWQLRVRSLAQAEGNPTDFVRSAPLSAAQLKEEIDQLVADMTNPIIREVTQEMLEMKKDDYYAYPAAVRNHHNFPGGLAWHSLSMARLAKSVLAQYDWLDYDLLIAGVILHDLAKTEEYSAPILPEYTVEGNLIGHISMVNTLLDRVALALDVQDSEEVMLLKHLVLSHHGKKEFGSPVLPMTPEAEALTLLDNIDSRLFMIHQSLESVEPGCFGPKNFALDNRMFYRKTWDDKDNKPIPPQSGPDKAEETACAQEKTESGAGQKQKPENAGHASHHPAKAGGHEAKKAEPAA